MSARADTLITTWCPRHHADCTYAVRTGEVHTVTTATLEPRIYVASLSDYNAGRLHGAWIDAAQDADDIHAAITAMLAASPEPGADEWAIHDYEGFGDIKISENEDIAAVAAIAAGIAEHGPSWAAYAARMGTDFADGYADDYCGEWDSEEDYATELLDDIGELKDDSIASRYFDYEKFTRDLFMTDYWSADSPDGGVFVFRTS